MKQIQHLWTVEEISKVVMTANNSINKSKTFKELAAQLGRSFYSIQNMYYECRDNFNTEISNEESGVAIRRLLERNISKKEVAKRHGITGGAVDLISRKEKRSNDVKHQVEPSFDSKQTRDDKIKELSQEGMSTRKIAKEVGLGRTMVGAVLNGYEYRKDKRTYQPRKINKENIASFELNFLWGLLRITKQ